MCMLLLMWITHKRSTDTVVGHVCFFCQHILLWYTVYVDVNMDMYVSVHADAYMCVYVDVIVDAYVYTDVTIDVYALCWC